MPVTRLDPKVEIAFPTPPRSTSPIWVDVTDYASEITSAKRGRQHELNEFEAGAGTMILDNSDRRFDPTYVGSPYWPNVRPMRRVRISGITNSTTKAVFTGYVLEWPPDWSGLDFSQTTVQLVDGIGVLSMSPLVGAFSQQLTGARINAVLDAVGWPAADRVIGTGLSTVVAATFLSTDKQMAWQHILDVAGTENGLAFVDAQGRFVFIDRQATLTAPYTTSQFTFDDTIAAQLFDDLTPTEEDDLLWNSVTVTDNSGIASTAIDSTSQNEYWPRSLPISTLLPTGSSEALDHAAFELAQFKDPYVRFASLEYIATTSDTLAAQALGREIGDRITIKKTPPGPPPQVSADAVIQSIEHKIVPGGGSVAPTWTVDYELSGAVSGTYATFDGTAIFDDPGAKFGY